MNTREADQLKRQIQAMTWPQLIALWKWLTLEIYSRMGRGIIGKDGNYL